jgi:hypothetical protein
MRKQKALPSVVDCYFSSPDESPMQHSREDGFSGLIDLWRMTDIEEPSRGAG